MKFQSAYSSSKKVEFHKDIRVVFTGKNLTKFGGIQLVKRFLRGLKVKEELESAVGIEKRDAKLSVGGMLICLIYALILNMRRQSDTLRDPSAAIVNFKQIVEIFSSLIREMRGDLYLDTKVEMIYKNSNGIKIDGNDVTFHVCCLINCAGFYSDRVAKLMNMKSDMKIVPSRGEYYELKPEKCYLGKYLIYPVPNPNFQFLGVHFTPLIGGKVHVGPNAALSFKREGYKKQT